MPTQHRWIASALSLTGALGLAAAAGLALSQRTDRLSYSVPAGQAQNALTLRVSGATLELVDGATQAVLQSRPLAGTQGVTILGAPGSVNDALTVDLSGGALALPDGIHFDGGAGGWDTLLVTGGEATTGSYAATGPQAGIITHGGTRIFFSNLEPVTDTVGAANFVISGTAGSNTINVVNGSTSCSGGCQTIQVNSPSFESVDFANKTNVTVAGGAGADTFIVTSTVPATGLSKLVLDGGGNPGDSIRLVNFVMPGGTLSLTNVVTITQSAVVSVTNLAAQAAGLINLSYGSNHVSNFAANVTGSGAALLFSSAVPTLTVGTVEGLVGIKTVNGPVSVEDTQLGGAVAVSNPIATAGGSLTVYADHMTLNAALNAGSGTVYLDNHTFPEPIVLGTKAANMLGLLQSDLNQVTAGILQIGDFGTDTGGLTVTANIIAPAGWSTLDLRQRANITELGIMGVMAPNLVVRAHLGSVDLTSGANRASVISGGTDGGDFAYTDLGHTTVGTVAGVSSVSSAGGSINLRSRRDGLTVDIPVLAGAGEIQLQASESAGTADDLNLGPGAVVSSTSNSIFLMAGDRINVGAGSVVAAGGLGQVTLLFSLNDSDNLGGATIAGTIASPNGFPQANGGPADDTLLVDFAAGAALPNELNYDGGSGQNTLTVSDASGSSPHAYSASGQGLSRDLTTLIDANHIQFMDVLGGSAADSFTIQPDPGVVFHISGGLPGSPPGDGLFINPLTTTNPTLAVTAFDATGESGQWTFGNRQPVNFTGIDSFENLTHKARLPLVRK